MSQTNLSSFIWSVAELLRRDYKQSEYGRVILPLTVLRRLEMSLFRWRFIVQAPGGREVIQGILHAFPEIMISYQGWTPR